MEKNCLVTKYKATVNNNSLLKVGEMRLEMGKSTNTNQNRINFANHPVVIETLDGSPSLTFDRNMLTGLTNKLIIDSNDKLFYSNSDVVVSVFNKYDVLNIMVSNATIDIDNLKYSYGLSKLENVKCRGSLESIKDKSIIYIYNVKMMQEQDISVLSNFTDLTSLFLGGSDVSGDISALSGLTKLTLLALGGTKVSGDISALSGLTELKSLAFVQTNVSGDISALSGLTGLTSLNFESCKAVSGDISSVGTLTSLKAAYLQKSAVRGDVIDYVISQRSHGRNTGSTTFTFSPNMTFNGIIRFGSHVISWTDSTITDETSSETVER